MEGSSDVFRHIIHYSFHLLVPFVFAKLFWKKNWWKAALIMLATMLIDLDHLLADPIFDPNRCSIGFTLSTVYGRGYFIAVFWPFLHGSGVQYLWDACGIYAPISLIVYLADYGPKYIPP